jgi:ABC-2 type transport system ATP-binding protein
MSPLLQVDSISKSYGTLRAVTELSFDVQAGEAFGLLGPNGAGKSTTMMMICGLLAPDAGRIVIDGQPLNRHAPASRRRMGVVSQELAVYPDLTGRENLAFFAGLYQVDRAARRARVADALEQVGLASRADDLVETYSGGMKRRLNFAAAVLHQPSLLILDEPTVGVDPQSRAHLLDCIRLLQTAGTAVIYASHYMEEVQNLCSRAAIVDRGRLVTCDTMRELLSQIPLQVEVSVDRDALPRQFDAGPGVTMETSGDITLLRVTATPDAPRTDLNARVTRLLNQLSAQAVHVRSIRTLESNLERLFLQLTGHTLRD